MIIVNNRDKLEHNDGMTVQDMLGQMGYSYKLITVTVNGEVVPHEDFEEFHIPDGADIGVFHLARGG